MLHRILVGLLVLAAAAPARGQNPPPRDTSALEATGSAIIRGRVVEAGTDRPVRIAFVPPGANEPVRIDKTAYTDAAGRYQIDGLPAGTYSVSVTKTNFAPAFFGVQRAVGPSKP